MLLLFMVGLCMGSFAGAVVWRVFKQSKIKSKNGRTEYSISQGRSMCEHCGHALATKDLIPLISYLGLRGECRYCQKPIARSVLAVELAGGIVFVLSYVFWPTELVGAEQIIPFVTWLLSSVGLLALALYDYKWYILPNRILYPTFYIALAGWLANAVLFNFEFESVLKLLSSIAIASGIFWLIYMLSKGRLIGFGDVRLGLVTGTLLADPRLSLLMIFVASLIGTLFAAPQLVAGKKTATSRIPYGPFLILGTAISLFFGESIITWYTNLLIL